MTAWSPALAASLKPRLVAKASGLAVLLACAGSALPSAAQSACGVTVTSLADSGAGTLRNAIAVAAAAGATTICFQTGLQGTLSLASSLQIGQTLSITGPGIANLTISGTSASGLKVQPFQINDTNPNDQIAISQMTISGGQAQNGGGLEVIAGNVTLTSVTITGNSAVDGGGIYNQGNLTLGGCGVTSNTTSDSSGGGIDNAAGGSLTLNNTTLDSNSALGGSLSGGGIENAGTVTITGGLFTGNSGSPGGAIDNTGILTLSGGTTFFNNTSFQGGGAIENEASGTATIIGATFNKNSTTAQFSGTTNGGGIENSGGTLTLHESTLTANTADGEGGGVFNNGQAALVQDTVTGNTAQSAGSGVSQAQSENANPLTLQNTIISGNTTDDCNNCGTIPTGNLVGGSAQLGILATNGGLTQTFMPLPGSPAISGGAFPAQDQTDQRGLSRTTLVGVDQLLLDIGSVQTHYNSVAFVQQPTSGTATQTIAPPVTVQVKEVDGNTINYPEGVPVYLTLQSQDSAGTPTLSGTIPQYPQVIGTSTVASFSDLSINVAGSFLLNATTYPGDPSGSGDAYSASSGSFTMSPPNPPTVNWAPPSFAYGPLPAAELNATVTQNGTTSPCTSCSYLFSASQAAIVAGTVYSAGSYPVVVIYTSPTGQTSTASASLLITQATPTLTLVSPPAVLPGAALSTANVHPVVAGVGGAAVSGTFAYSPALGSALASGSPVAVTFTPSGADATNYTAVSASSTVNVLAPSATATTLIISPSTANAGTAETISAQVSSSNSVGGVVNGNLSIATDSVGTQPLLLPSTGGVLSEISPSPFNFSAPGQLAAYTADLNGDGVADQVLTGGAATSQIQLLFSDPAHAGSYLSESTLSTYGGCFAVTGIAIGDVNGDGLPDIVAACQNTADDPSQSPILLYLNQGNGSFSAGAAIGGQGSSPMQGAQVALADFDGDGKLDLVSLATNCPTGGTPCFAFQHGNGDGTFNAATYTQIDAGTSGDNYLSLIAADFNGDGAADVAFINHAVEGIAGITVWVSNATSPVTFGENNGGNACSPGPCYDANTTIESPTSGNAASMLVAADLNGDGILDLAAVSSDGGSGSGNAIAIALNGQGSGTVNFAGTTVDTPFPGLQGLAVADFNQDGKADLAVYSSTNSQISILPGDGTGAFSSEWNASLGVNGPVTGDNSSILYPVFNVGDVNGDGFPDVLLAEPTTSGGALATLAVTTGATQATFATVAPAQSTTYTGSTTPSSKLWSASSGSAVLTVNASTVTLAWAPAPITYGQTVPASDLQATATVNGAAATGTFVYTFTSGNVISTSTVYPAAAYSVQVTFTPTGSTQQYTLGTTLTVNQATPTVALVTPPALLPGAKLSTANVHALVTGATGAALAGTPGYSPALGTVLTSGQTVSVTFAPADATDYVAPAPATVQVNVLSPLATTTALTASPNPALPGAAVVLTATVAPASGTAGAVPGQVVFSAGSSAAGTGTLALAGAEASFQPAASHVASPSLADKPIVFTADFNGDGLADMLELVPAATTPGTLTLLLSQAPGAAYGAPLAVSLDANCSVISNVAIGDLNGDGLPDIVASCATGALISFEVLLNQGNGIFAAPIRVTDPIGAFINGQQVGVGDFNADGKLDVVVVGARCGSDSSNACLVFEPGDGAGNFAAAVYTQSPASLAASYSAPVVADFDGDGLPDLAFFTAAGPLQVWRNNGGASVTFGTSCGEACFNPSASITEASGNTLQGTPVAASLRNGFPDLAAISSGTGSQALSVALNSSTSGTISFPAATTDTAISGATALAAGDFDHDGHVDFAIYETADNAIRVYEGDGTGAFANKYAGLAQSVSGAAFAAADANGDGIPDLIVLQVTANTYTADNFITSGAALATANTTAPVVSTVYTATAAPSVPDWASSTATTTLTTAAVPTQTTLSVTGLPATGSPVYGTTLTLTSVVTNVGTTTPAAGGSVTFTDNGAAIVSSLNPVSLDASGTATLSVTPTAGSHVYDAIYGGTTGEGTSTAPSSSVTVAKFTPTISWPTPAAITTTTPLSATQLDATLQGLPGTTLALPGTPVYTPTFGATLPQGTDALSVVYTPTDTADYNAVSKSISILVNNTNTQTTFTITPASANGSYTYGQALTLTASVTNTTGSTVIQGGTVTFSSDGVALSSVTVANGAATLSGVVLTGGTHLIGAAYTGEAGEGTSAAASQSITVAKATPTLTWPTPAPITTSTPLSATQLDATATGTNGASLAGTPTYTPAAGATLPFGTQTLSVSFAPADATDYTTATRTVSIQVVAAPTQTSLAVSARTSTYGQALTLTATVTNTGQTAPVQTGTVTFSQNGATLSTVAVSNGTATLSGVSLPAGTPVLEATYNGTSGETLSTATVTVTINKATPTLSWPTPATITSTTPLSAEQLDATAAGATGAALPGSFVYNPASGTLSVGTHTLSVTFAPTDTNNYTAATATVAINVIATNTVTTFTVAPAAPTYGQPLTLTALVANTTGSTVIQTGSVVFTSDTVTLGTVSVVNGSASLGGISPTAGAHLLTASYTGAAGEGTSAAAAQSVNVAKGAPVLTWPTPAPIASTTPLSATQLDATAVGITAAPLPGAFVYTPAAGGVLTVGTHPLSVTFTPTDTINYATATDSVVLKVVPETIALASISPATTTIANTPLTVTLTGSGFPSTAVVLLNGAQISSTVLSATQLSATVPASNLAKPGTLNFTLYDKASLATSNPVSLPVTAPTPTATVTVPPTVTSGDQPTLGITLAAPYPVDIAGTYTLAFTPSGSNGVDDPAIQFSSGGTSFGFTIPAGQTSAGAASLQTGTVEGTIAIATLLSAGGVDVTPPAITTGTDLTIAPAAPVITGVTFTQGTGATPTGTGGVGLSDTNGLLTITVTGYSNTREMTQANFTFTGPGAGDLASPQVTVPAAALFTTWYSNASSAAYGSTFSYTQTFQLSDPTTNITGAAVTLTNSIGTSASVNSQ